MPGTLAPASLSASPPAPRLEQGERRAGGQEAAIGRVVGGAGREPGGGSRRGMTATRTPAGRGGPARPGPVAAERAGPALQKAAAGWPGRSHSAAGAGFTAALPSHTGDPGQRADRAGNAPCSGADRAARASSGGAADPRPLRLCALPAARPALPASPGPRRDGVGAAPQSGDGPPSGHRTAPRGLTDREDRGRWVWAGRTERPGRQGYAGAGKAWERKWAAVGHGEPRGTVRLGTA